MGGEGAPLSFAECVRWTRCPLRTSLRALLSPPPPLMGRQAACRTPGFLLLPLQESKAVHGLMRLGPAGAVAGLTCAKAEDLCYRRNRLVSELDVL